MTPWPTADVQASFNYNASISPTISPHQQAHDSYAPFDGPAPGLFGPEMPQVGQMPDPTNGGGMPPGPAPVQQQQEQQQRSVDPFASMMAPSGQMPARAHPIPTMTPPSAPTMASAPVDDTPPPTLVVTDQGNQLPPSPIGDVSVLAASDLPPAVPRATQDEMQAQAPPAIVPVQESGNPFEFGAMASALSPAETAAPRPAAMPPQAPPSPPGDDAQAQTQNGFSVNHPFTDPFGYAFSPMTSPVASPVTSPVTSPNHSPGDGAMVPSAAPNSDPFGVFGSQQPPAQAFGMTPSHHSQAPVQAPVQAPAQAPVQAPAGIPHIPVTQAPAPVTPTRALVASTVPADPFAMFGSQPAPANNDPFSGGTLVTSAAAPPAGGPADDPFGIFNSQIHNPGPTQAPAQAPAQASIAQQTTPVTPNEADPWAAVGFGEMVAPKPAKQSAHVDPRPEEATSISPNLTPDEDKHADVEERPITLDSNGLPSDGEYYEARINARSLGAMFYTARNLEETLFTKMPDNILGAIGSRPVVAYVADNSAAYNSGVTLGHIVLSVNGTEVSDPERCADTIRNCSRPMNLRCYVPPNMTLTLSEGKHLVKYDTKEMEAPYCAVDWKRKYVVVGGIIAKPWMMNMFYSKKDYDTAVKEAHAGYKVSVKVKQFDLRGARIALRGRDGKPNWVDYPSERHAWHYITVLPAKGYPIKISSESVEELEPVYSAIRRFIKKDMEVRYQFQLSESFGTSGGTGVRDGGVGGSRRSVVRSGKGRNPPGFEQFGDAPGNDYWR